MAVVVVVGGWGGGVNFYHPEIRCMYPVPSESKPTWHPTLIFSDTTFNVVPKTSLGYPYMYMAWLAVHQKTYRCLTRINAKLAHYRHAFVTCATPMTLYVHTQTNSMHFLL